MEFDLIAINQEFQKLLKKHENDTEVTGVDKKAFEDVTSYHEEDKCGNEESLRKFWAMAYNAYEELCNKHQGLRETYGWYAGADGAGYPNPYDLYIGTGDEEEQRRPKRKDPGAVTVGTPKGEKDWSLLLESLVLLSADLYQRIYEQEDCYTYTEAASQIIDLAKKFEKELNWQEDDERDYIEELEKFEKKVLEKLEKDHD